ncbi:MAG: restriction endonuclease [Bacteroidetes bacterium]|jgi:restriction system protein|nr:restriction endonuclease [Bacteroidota bacterium]MBT6686430.1 restriction endonuclease [Bacteroidota bacterium]MBT7144669.1 restriction endonuclease [Bacteroidota bacterium]MBT7491296.1 restriction endonuclease [Bacteroidota bacterium]
MSEKKRPIFLRFLNPIINVLNELGGSGNSSEVTDLVVERMNIPESELEEKLQSGATRVRNQIAWARIYLVKSGLLDDSSKRGIWSLTTKGAETKLSFEDSLKLFKEVQSKFIQKGKKTKKETKVQVDDIEEQVINVEGLSDDLLTILQNLSPKGFERICQRLLRESGFKKVVVTGKSGDGGIDGEGILEINPLMSFKVLFQAKRYQGTVGSSTIRDFRGAMQGRADKGIIITTGRFTQDAKKEAIRDGAPPVELVDGEILVELFEKNELGLKPKIVYDIDKEFFIDFMK